MLARLDATVLALGPRVVFLMGGTNDVTQGRPVTAAVANLHSIVDRLKARDIEVVLFTVPPRNEPTYAAPTLALDRAITRLARDERVPVIDAFGVLAGPDGTSTGIEHRRGPPESGGLPADRRRGAGPSRRVGSFLRPSGCDDQTRRG